MDLKFGRTFEMGRFTALLANFVTDNRYFKCLITSSQLINNQRSEHCLEPCIKLNNKSINYLLPLKIYHFTPNLSYLLSKEESKLSQWPPFLNSRLLNMQIVTSPTNPILYLRTMMMFVIS